MTLDFLLTVCLALIAGSLPASSATRHVVMLFDERLEFPGLASLEAEFVRSLASNSPDHIETYREPMDLSRFDSDAYRTLLKDYLRAKYANKNIDVVVAFFEPALDFLLNSRRRNISRNSHCVLRGRQSRTRRSRIARSRPRSFLEAGSMFQHSSLRSNCILKPNKSSL